MSEGVMEEPLWTIEDLAAYLQVPVASVRKWRTNNDGPRGLLVGRHIRYRRADVMTWLEGR